MTPRRLAGVAGALLAVCALLVTAASAALRWWPALQLHSLGTIAVAGVSDVFVSGSVVAAVVGTAVAWWGGAPGRRWWSAVPVVPLAVLVSMSWPTLAGLARPEDPPAGPTLRVVAQNMWKDHPDPARAGRVVVGTHADVLVLSELTPRLQRAVLDAAGDRYPYRVLRARPGSDGMAILSEVPLTAGRQVSRYRTEVVLHPVGARAVDLVGVHLPSPTREGLVTWEQEYARLRSLVGRRGPGVVVAGDFNGSAALVPFRALVGSTGLRDAQDVGGGGFRPTWSEVGLVPPLLRLDHVLVTDATGVAGFAFVPRTGSDHRGVEATLRLRRLPA